MEVEKGGRQKCPCGGGGPTQPPREANSKRDRQASSPPLTFSFIMATRSRIGIQLRVILSCHFITGTVILVVGSHPHHTLQLPR